MKKISMWLGVALVAALLGVACGKKAPAAEETLPSNTGGEDTTATDDGTGDEFGGGMYGGGEYGYDDGGE